MNFKLGVSTIFFFPRITKEPPGWEKIKKELEELGVDSIELNTDIPLSWMEEIKKDVSKNKIKILSLHNFCPSVENIPKGKTGFNVYSLSSDNDEERNLAVQYTKRTIDFAQQLNAEVVIVHSGEILTEPTGREFYKFVNTYGITSQLYKKYSFSLSRTRSLNKEKYFSLLLNSFDKIVSYAEEKNVVLGIETRVFPHEIPDFTEIGELIQHYSSKHVRYWHDFGHAEVLTRLGFADGHEKYFEKYGEQLIGYHIHDVKCDTSHYPVDHFAPGYGEINFKDLIEPSEEKIFILEIHPKESFDKLNHGIKIIKDILTKKQIL